MKKETREAIKQFFAAQKKLNELGIIRSKNYLEDISRYLCKIVYHLEYAETARQAHYDGTIGISKVRVKFNNCPTGTKIRLFEPIEFDELIVVLGPNSWLRPENTQDDFVFYRFTREEVLERFEKTDGVYVGGESTLSQGPDKVLSLT